MSVRKETESSLICFTHWYFHEYAYSCKLWTVESHKISQYFTPEFSEQVENFDLNLIPTEQWNQDKIRSLVGHRIY